MEKWTFRLKGGDASQMKFDPKGNEATATEEVTGLPINQFCDPPGEAPLIEYKAIIQEVGEVEAGAKPTITAHCRDDAGKEFIQVIDSNGQFPVFQIDRSPSKGKIAFIKSTK